MTKIGFIGLGRMGKPMALNLARKGLDLAIFDIDVQGAFICGAFSGFGIMSACASGELIAKHVTNGMLPSYAKAFNPSRFSDSRYLAEIKTWDVNGQL